MPTVQIAVGFVITVAERFARQIQVLTVAGGRTQVLERFLSDEVVDMEACPDRYMVLLIDFDGNGQRLSDAKSRIPEPLRERVFILGVWSEPEELKKDLGSYEAIGSAMARDCRQGTDTTWDYHLLRHNAGELARLCKHVGPILF